MEDRITTGNSELDEMLGGGFLPNHVVVVAGPAGSGKTITAFQFIYKNLQDGKRCLFVSASDDEESIVKNALRFGWDMKPYIENNKLSIIDVTLAEGGEHTLATDLLSEHGMISDYLEQLPGLIKSSKAEVVAIDSITEFNDLCTTELERRARLLDLRKIIKEIGATALITAEAALEGYSTKYGIAEYTADGLIFISRFQSKDFSQFMHVMQIVKMRWTAHSREIRVYNITNSGIELQSPLYTTLASGGKL